MSLNRVLHLSVARKLLERRKELGLSRNNTAIRSGMDGSRLRKIEIGETDIKVSTLIKLMSVLDLELVFKPAEKKETK